MKTTTTGNNRKGHSWGKRSREIKEGLTEVVLCESVLYLEFLVKGLAVMVYFFCIYVWSF